MEDSGDRSSDLLLRYTTEIVTAYASNNPTPADQLADVINSVHRALAGLRSSPTEEAPSIQKPAVPVRRSIQPDFLVCLEDGKKLKMLKRYLRTAYGMTPDEYRTKWNLPPDYPMVAPNYAKQRSEFAKKIGLGKAN